jgi:hypothetical protein
MSKVDEKLVLHGEGATYEEDGRTYMRVGAYGLDDLEYIVQEDGSVYLPETEDYYTTLNEAYTKENTLWLKHEEELSND